MTFRPPGGPPPGGPPPDGPPPELPTTRISSGVSARLVAVAVVGLLFAVVGFTVVNRPPPLVQQPPTSPAVGVGPTPAPSHNNITGDDGFVGGMGLRVAQVPAPAVEVRDYGFAAVIQITGGNLQAALDLDGSEVYRARASIPSAGLGKVLPIEVGRVWSEGGGIIYDSFGSWAMPLKALRKSHGGLLTLLVKFVPPDPTPDVPGAPTTGYTFTVTGYHVGDNFTLMLQLVWPAIR